MNNKVINFTYTDTQFHSLFICLREMFNSNYYNQTNNEIKQITSFKYAEYGSKSKRSFFSFFFVGVLQVFLLLSNELFKKKTML